MILVLDNYDSFVHNLARYVEELGEQVRVVRNDATDVDGLLDLAPSHVIVSPGPCTPMEAGTSVDLIRVAGRLVPVLGVCLGHQCVGTAFGARVVRGPPVHGKVSSIVHEERGLFHGLPSPLSGTRYHSLVVDPATLPDELVATAWTEDGVLMALRHDRFPVWGVQFHPEAVLTGYGHALLRNFLALGRNEHPPGLGPGLPIPERPRVLAGGIPQAASTPGARSESATGSR